MFFWVLGVSYLKASNLPFDMVLTALNMCQNDYKTIFQNHIPEFLNHHPGHMLKTSELSGLPPGWLGNIHIFCFLILHATLEIQTSFMA